MRYEKYEIVKYDLKGHYRDLSSTFIHNTIEPIFKEHTERFLHKIDEFYRGEESIYQKKFIEYCKGHNLKIDMLYTNESEKITHNFSEDILRKEFGIKTYYIDDRNITLGDVKYKNEKYVLSNDIWRIALDHKAIKTQELLNALIEIINKAEEFHKKVSSGVYKNVSWKNIMDCKCNKKKGIVLNDYDEKMYKEIEEYYKKLSTDGYYIDLDVYKIYNYFYKYVENCRWLRLIIHKDSKYSLYFAE